MSSVKIIGLGKDFERRVIQQVRVIADRQIEQMARETASVMQQKIVERIEREGSTGDLVRGITAFPLDGGGWGVGDIAYLNENVKYWYWQNFGVAQSGRTTPPANYGHFPSGSPKTGGGKERWIHTGNSNDYLIQPNKPIEAKNYIEATIAELRQIIQSNLRKGL